MLSVFADGSGSSADDVRPAPGYSELGLTSGRRPCFGYACVDAAGLCPAAAGESSRPGPRDISSSRPSSPWTDWSLVNRIYPFRRACPLLGPRRSPDADGTPSNRAGSLSAFPIQAATLPDSLAGRDVCGKAPTGSGKTLAFGLAILSRLAAKPWSGRRGRRHPSALVLVPTRELAAQIEEVIAPLAASDRCPCGVDLRRRRVRQAADRPAPRRRRARRLPGAAHRPARAGLGQPVARGRRRRRRGRPHGRHGLPARRSPPHRQDERVAPDPALLGDARTGPSTS